LPGVASAIEIAPSFLNYQRVYIWSSEILEEADERSR